MQITEFFYSTSGKITTGTLILIFALLFILYLHRGNTLSAKTMTYSALCIALATVLSNIKLFNLPQGGTVTACSMLFVSLIGYWFGKGPGILAAITYGFIQLIFNPYIVHPMQLLLDYPMAFGALGLSGFFRSQRHGLLIGYVSGCVARWFFSTLSGIIFFAEYAGEANPIVYSLLYNGSYIVPEIILSLLLLSIPAFSNAIHTVKNMAMEQMQQA